MKILITGGAGFLGTNLTVKLLSLGHDVFVVDNFSTGNPENIKQFANNPHFNFTQMDIVSEDFLKKFLDSKEKFDQIFHLACPTGVPNIQILGEEMIDTCSTGTKNVLMLTKSHGSKFLFTSSSEVYGEPEKFPQDESYTGNVDPQGDRSSYEEGKRFSESLVHLFVNKYHLDARTVRLFNAYGPFFNPKDQRVIAVFVQQALQNQPITLQGDGSQKRTMTFVDDIVSGLLLVMEKGDPGSIFNLGSTDEVTMSQFADLVIKLCDSKSEIVHVERPRHDHSARMPDLTKATRLGYKPAVPLEEGLKKTIQYFREILGKK